MKQRSHNATLRLYTDEDVHYGLAAALRNLGHDADAFKDHATAGWSDAQQLAKAVDLGRAVVTSNRKDFRLLHEALYLWHGRWRVRTRLRHHGILIVPHDPVQDLTRIVDEFASAHTTIDNRISLWRPRAGWQEFS